MCAPRRAKVGDDDILTTAGSSTQSSVSFFVDSPTSAASSVSRGASQSSAKPSGSGGCCSSSRAVSAAPHNSRYQPYSTTHSRSRSGSVSAGAAPLHLSGPSSSTPSLGTLQEGQTSVAFDPEDFLNTLLAGASVRHPISNELVHLAPTTGFPSPVSPLDNSGNVYSPSASTSMAPFSPAESAAGQPPILLEAANATSPDDLAWLFQQSNLEVLLPPELMPSALLEGKGCGCMCGEGCTCGGHGDGSEFGGQTAERIELWKGTVEESSALDWDWRLDEGVMEQQQPQQQQQQLPLPPPLPFTLSAEGGVR
jgi:hypothetical protein